MKFVFAVMSIIYICGMKKIIILFSIFFISIVSYAQSPIESIGLVFGITKEDVQSRLENKGLRFEAANKDMLIINQQVESAGSQFGKCTLIFKKEKLIEANFEQVLTKSEERIASIKFPAISRWLSEKYVMRRYMEKSRNGYYNGWKSDENGYALLRWEKQDDGTSRLNLIFSPKGLF